MAKKIKKFSQKKIDQIKKVKDALLLEQITPPQEGFFSPKWFATLIGRIANSPLENDTKAVFLYSIAKGTFDLEMYEMYLNLMDEYKAKLQKRADELEKKIHQLKSDIDDGAQQLSRAAVGACQEIQAAAEHIEKRTILQVEKVSEEAAALEVQAIQERLKKSQK